MHFPAHLRTSSTAPSGEPRVSLFHPDLKQQRKKTFITVCKVFGMITIAMWLFLSIYFGSYYRQTENTHRLKVLVLDLDSAAATFSRSAGNPTAATSAYNAIVGPAVVASAQSYLTNVAPKTNSTTWSLGYEFPTEEQIAMFALPYNGTDGVIANTPGMDAANWAEEQVHGQTYWGVILIRGNATMAALNAVSEGDSTYDPMGSIAIYYTEARNFFTANQYVSSQIIQLVSAGVNEANMEHALTVVQQAVAGVGGGVTYLTNAPEAGLTRAFAYSEYNLQPFDQLAGEAATTAGAIYLIIFVFFFTPIWTGVYGTIRSKLALGSDMFISVFANLGYYFWISLHYSLMSLAFQVNFTRARGYGGFPLFWLMNFVTMAALGFPMQIMFEILGQPFFPFFLSFWVILNVSVAFLDVADMDPFYSYAFAFPVWNNIDTAKHLFFATKSHIVQNFAVNLAWAIISGLLLCVLVLRRRAKESKDAWAKHKKEIDPPKKQLRLVL